MHASIQQQHACRFMHAGSSRHAPSSSSMHAGSCMPGHPGMHAAATAACMQVHACRFIQACTYMQQQQQQQHAYDLKNLRLAENFRQENFVTVFPRTNSREKNSRQEKFRQKNTCMRPGKCQLAGKLATCCKSRIEESRTISGNFGREYTTKQHSSSKTLIQATLP